MDDMTATASAAPPDYPYCGRGADPSEDPVGCRGYRVLRMPVDVDEGEGELYDGCLAHLTDADRDAYLMALSPGSDLHHRGTTFDAPLLNSLLNAVRDPATGRPRLSRGDFREATFEGGALFFSAVFEGGVVFYGATFGGDAVFDGAVFEGGVVFYGATFGGHAVFDRATFERDAVFDRATFERDAMFTSATIQGHGRFDEATFKGKAWFNRAAFGDGAVFGRATFRGNARFDGAAFGDGAVFYRATFGGDAVFTRAAFQGNSRFDGATFQGGGRFDRAKFQGDADFRESTFQSHAHFREAAFEQASRVGPVMCEGIVDLSAAVFDVAVIIEVTARGLWCRRTRWASTAALRLRNAKVDLSDAVLEFPVSVTAHATPFRREPEGVGIDESGIAPAPVRMLYLRGVDAAHLSLTDVDLTACQFAGTVHLDQLRLYGRCPLAPAPGGWHRRGLLPVRFTARQALAEEHHWRAARPGSAEGWTPHPEGNEPLGPAALVPLYRELRKALEDGKNEPGAADFYYGEMEMRRHGPRTPAAERFLLRLYWVLSGYGLRASRALGWLLGAMAATVLLMMAVGLPDTPAQPHPPGAGVIGKQDPELHAAFAERFTGARAQKAADVVIASVVFRSSGQDLTTAGRYTEMASRFTEPVLLGLAALAIRGRVKR